MYPWNTRQRTIGALLVGLTLAALSACASEEPAARATAVPLLPTIGRPPLTSPSVSPSRPIALSSPSPLGGGPVSGFTPVTIGGPTTGTTAGNSGATASTYTVASGDSLSEIARKVYGDASEWRPIYEANRDRMDGPESLRIGMNLRIPPRPTVQPTRAQTTPLSTPLR